MCGMNWYREEMERAEEDLDRLTQLLAMMEERYKLSLAEPDSNRLSPDIVDVYLELVSRKKALTMNKSPQA
ncbi:hypothetical protein M7775_08915 [Sporomusa sphaeroides DSM 2875]|uniref:hypothetical protein n=1 Tax=Sporomusa sphaeroides TaxID=47679 RepID=UPI0020309453|nr:hypothetical protein [Sporomusa sphaeroides]MCM0758689.1 hypothetical protein [Sporomusa sphaeroides DSM 2875]